jgi:DNA-binding MarR family transcriptional regulator
MTKLTPKQQQVLDAIRETPASGTCVRYEWTFRDYDGNPITRQVKALQKKGLVNIMYFRGGRAAVNINHPS